MRFLSLPIRPILLCSLLSISLIPTLIVSLDLYTLAEKNSQKMLEEKHLNLAKNLTAPIYSYLENHQTIVKSISRRLVEDTTSDFPINNFFLDVLY